eukprot:CAMPEP_0177291628 /NCGR_PEP_ID=MMETSP0367-20130122/76359_1 /TAXON_ID=447022 ORGANISM="Scrippsiella hangoei-like, Strain SHHI-4" /NCGR_SAMPLE_ID=MMETSP0367 /ASSEMBLY_ACC=CAM_ASM_000362 /LENGTH=109 /DNA_ID=CAMNT_0018749157 /DNA_START=130 /DNA_END=459 /DNA_ORIENTATION=-
MSPASQKHRRASEENGCRHNLADDASALAASLRAACACSVADKVDDDAPVVVVVRAERGPGVDLDHHNLEVKVPSFAIGCIRRPIERLHDAEAVVCSTANFLGSRKAPR